MKIMILTVGSRGDIQPFLALAVGLQKAGHAVTINTSATFRDFITGYGVAHAEINDDLIRLSESDEGRAALEGKGKLALLKKVKPMLQKMLADEWTAVQNAQPDLLIYHPKALGGYHLAEKRNIPGVMSIPLPIYTPTREFPSPILPPLKLGGWYNRLTYKLIGLVQAPYMGLINTWRKESLGLPPRSVFANDLQTPDGRSLPVLYPFSTHVVPRPADWPAEALTPGYWFLPPDPHWQPSPALSAFLQAGPPPVYVGFGSMAGTDPARLTEAVIAALAQSGQRGLLATGWGGLKPADLPSNLFVLDAAPHDWLLPQMAAVVHHGGAGTTAASLRAGKPTLICPFFGDQPFWGQRVFELGAGPRPIPQKQVTAVALAAAITEMVHNQIMQSRAAELGRKIQAEDGVATAVAWLNGIGNGRS